jgi:hypothetical protein
MLKRPLPLFRARRKGAGRGGAGRVSTYNRARDLGYCGSYLVIYTHHVIFQKSKFGMHSV